ncbi:MULTISPECIES: FRG domain-containing protein [Staphylococcus]|uniref:FRG domain-containing protein n=1 Tax=Staphylococcus TaxID=1279 RepID=UPI001E35BA91|nr:FRG domain-containing protein [Staphylococcus arlettae]MCD8906961.1 FRG domain-containing protein [Staphylococcus arlettae]UXU49132.1 FRG domain-containing protein [Staphylococcus arlettae]
MNKFTYEDVISKYKEEDYFDKIIIKVNIEINDPHKGNVASYKIDNLELKIDDNFKNEKLLKKVERIKKDIENDIISYRSNNNKEWNIFYLYKEFFQKLEEDFNYYRGQCTDWEMLPGIIRENVNTKLRNDFEFIYQDVMYRYPDVIKYYPPIAKSKIINKREQQLAHLQHYGLKTSLIDITENPYIALLFMVSDTSKKDFKNAIIDFYSINQMVHTEKNLFSRVKMLKSNSRLIAQKGAFFNFDKIALRDLPTQIHKIPLVRLQLSFNFKELEKTSKLLEDSNVKLERLNKKLYDADKIENIESKVLRDLFEQQKYRKELKTEINSLKKYFDDILLDSIRFQIKSKLSEYHYIESELFPDLYKYIGYIQSGYDSDKDIKKPNLENIDDKSQNTKQNLRKLLNKENKS